MTNPIKMIEYTHCCTIRECDPEREDFRLTTEFDDCPYCHVADWGEENTVDGGAVVLCVKTGDVKVIIELGEDAISWKQSVSIPIPDSCELRNAPRGSNP